MFIAGLAYNKGSLEGNRMSMTIDDVIAAIRELEGLRLYDEANALWAEFGILP